MSRTALALLINGNPIHQRNSNKIRSPFCDLETEVIHHRLCNSQNIYPIYTRKIYAQLQHPGLPVQHLSLKPLCKTKLIKTEVSQEKKKQQETQSKSQRGKEWWDSTQALPRHKNKGLFPAKTFYICQTLLLELYSGNEQGHFTPQRSFIFVYIGGALSCAAVTVAKNLLQTKH